MILYISTIFSFWLAGLGNVLFQISACHVFAEEAAVGPCLVGFYKHWNRKFKTFDVWGGHFPPGGGGINLKHVFPQLQWIDFEPEASIESVRNDYAFEIVRSSLLQCHRCLHRVFISNGMCRAPTQYICFYLSHRWYREFFSCVLGACLIGACVHACM